MQQIVVITGAGSSKEINSTIYTGLELVNAIADQVTDRQTPGKQFLSRELEKQLNLSDSQINAFQKALDEYISSSMNPSIDEFLNKVDTEPIYVDYRSNFLKIGYVLILALVFGFEGEEKDATQQNMFNTETWLSVLKKYIDDNQILSKSKDISLSIITFNYDRIIEHYLLKTYNNSEEIINFIDSNIYHVYGRAGCLEGLKKRTIAPDKIEVIASFGRSNGNLREFMENFPEHISLMYTSRDDSKELVDIKKVISKADKILVFGYGYDDFNNKRIGLDECSKLHYELKLNIYHKSYTDKKNTLENLGPKSPISTLSGYEFLKNNLH